MNYPNEYENYKKLSDQELSEIMAGREEIGSKAKIARLVLEERKSSREHEYEKEQIELQHRLNKKNIEHQHSLNKQVVDKQIKVTIICTIVTAIATVLAAIAGTYLAYTLSKLKDFPELQMPAKQTFQSQTIPSTSVIRPEQKNDKVPLSPPK